MFTHPNERKQTQNKAETNEISWRISEFPWTNYGCFSRHLYLGLQKCRCLSPAHDSLSKKLSFRDATTGFPAKWPLRQISHAARPIRSTSYPHLISMISALVCQTSGNVDCFLRLRMTAKLAYCHSRPNSYCDPFAQHHGSKALADPKPEVSNHRLPLSLQSRTCETPVRKCQTTALARNSAPS